jgi:hypothetical protein
MEKPKTPSGFYYSEGDFLFRDIQEMRTEDVQEEKLKMDTTFKEGIQEDHGPGSRVKRRPNVFIAVELDDPGIRSAMEEVQETCALYDPSLRRLFESTKKCHVTLLVASVQEEELQKARTIIEKTLREKIVNNLTDNQFYVGMKGIDSFGDRVVYVA